jgi:hypothetical protein
LQSYLVRLLFCLCLLRTLRVILEQTLSLLLHQVLLSSNSINSSLLLLKVYKEALINQIIGRSSWRHLHVISIFTCRSWFYHWQSWLWFENGIRLLVQISQKPLEWQKTKKIITKSRFVRKVRGSTKAKIFCQLSVSSSFLASQFMYEIVTDLTVYGKLIFWSETETEFKNWAEKMLISAQNFKIKKMCRAELFLRSRQPLIYANHYEISSESVHSLFGTHLHF